MGAVVVDAGWIGPDGLGGAYKNKAEVLQAQTWFALGGQQGVIKGMGLTGVPGSMSITVATGSCLVSRRDGSNNVQDMGYLLPVQTATTVAFDPASPSARNDALVAAVIDTTDGAVGTGGLAVGGQLAVVPGVSGTSTPRTDAQIAAYLGRGGFVRLADVPIASTDTQINMANVVTTAASYQQRLVRAKQSASLAVASTTPTAVPGAAVVMYFSADAQYRYSLSVDIARTGTGNNPIRIGVFVDGSALSDSLNIVMTQGTSNLVTRVNSSVTDWISGLSTGTHTVDVRAYHDSGTSSSWTVNAARLVIERI